jgi:hypothetical protein
MGHDVDRDVRTREASVGERRVQLAFEVSDLDTPSREMATSMPVVVVSVTVVNPRHP